MCNWWKSKSRRYEYLRFYDDAGIYVYQAKWEEVSRVVEVYGGNIFDIHWKNKDKKTTRINANYYKRIIDPLSKCRK